MAIGEHDFPTEPITLIEMDSEGNDIQINHKALQLLQQLEGKVCVLAMAGMCFERGTGSLKLILQKGCIEQENLPC